MIPIIPDIYLIGLLAVPVACLIYAVFSLKFALSSQSQMIVDLAGTVRSLVERAESSKGRVAVIETALGKTMRHVGISNDG